ncbi:SDR family NAD(P)-dependent oxidoreductase [Amnibacterium kyonggiense]
MGESQLSGKVALVTGASSGIGAATARALAAAGAAVAIGARRADRLQELAEQIEQAGGRVLRLDLDVTDERSAVSAVQRTVDELGRIDVVVNAAGLMLLGPIVDGSTEDWRRMMTTNVLGLMYVTHAAIPHLVEQGSGDVINISSVAGRTAKPGSGVYNASKWAVNAFSESLRQEVTAKGVRITLIEPGAVDTELNDRITDEEAKAASKKSYDSMRTLHAEDVAAAIVYTVTQPDHVAVNEILIRPTDQPTP